jgi:septal ring factor EnvC (AmiA/AmiB activator)
MRIRIISLCMAMTWCSISGNPQASSEKIRKEILDLKRQIKAKDARAQSLTEKIDDMQREIGLQNKLVQTLESERKAQERAITRTQKDLQMTREEYERLKVIVGERMVSMYKRGRKSDWEVLLTLSSFSQAMVWMRYQKLVIQNDARNLRLLQDKEAAIQRQEADLQTGLKKKEALILSKREEMLTLEDQKTARTQLLDQVKKDRNYLNKRLQERENALSRIAKLIREQQEKPKTRAPVHSAIKTDFSKMQGKLGWPVDGNVTSNYGWQKDPVLNTRTLNPGVDITTAPGSAARTPCAGQVAVVTWQRGMGHLVLVNHGDEYITVYGHLDMVLVDSGQEVNQGSVIGHVGDAESIYGPTLHFEVWKGKEHLNPKLWLLK